jgi:hypothetical protein
MIVIGIAEALRESTRKTVKRAHAISSQHGKGLDYTDRNDRRKKKGRLEISCHAMRAS